MSAAGAGAHYDYCRWSLSILQALLQLLFATRSEIRCQGVQDEERVCSKPPLPVYARRYDCLHQVGLTLQRAMGNNGKWVYRYSSSLQLLTVLIQPAVPYCCAAVSYCCAAGSIQNKSASCTSTTMLSRGLRRSKGQCSSQTPKNKSSTTLQL